MGSKGHANSLNKHQRMGCKHTSYSMGDQVGVGSRPSCGGVGGKVRAAGHSRRLPGRCSRRKKRIRGREVRGQSPLSRIKRNRRRSLGTGRWKRGKTPQKEGRGKGRRDHSSRK